MEPASAASSPVTVVGLFDDEIDAENALNALRKASRPSSSISVLARDRSADEESRGGPVDVTRAVMDTALASVSNWLTGLAALMVSDNGTFLAAGPIGVVLARMRSEALGDIVPPKGDGEGAQVVGNVGFALEQFGFNPDEAHYLEQRLGAGSVLIAVTSTDDDQIASSRRTFADYDAVFVGQAETRGEVVAEAERWIARPLTERASEVIIADVVVTLRHACEGSRSSVQQSDRCGSPVVDQAGTPVGEVDDLLIDAVDDEVVRYVVVGHGGILGIARRRFAVPGDAVSFEAEQVRIRADAEKTRSAPAYDGDLPFSRKDELEVQQFFGTRPYWLVD